MITREGSIPPVLIFRSTKTNGDGDAVTMGRKWYEFYMLVLEHFGFTKEDIVFTEYKTSASLIAMDAVALQEVLSSEDKLSANFKAN